MADVAMPRLSDSMEEGTILKWLKSEGDDVAVGDELVEIETDKANMTYEAEAAGALSIVAAEGETLAVGATIARLGVREEAAVPVAVAEPVAAEPVAPSPDANGRAKASPVARRIARERGLDLGAIAGTGPGGRIVKSDVEAAAGIAPSEPVAAPAPVAAPPAGGDGKAGRGEIAHQELTRLQQTVARRMAESKATAPDFTITLEVDMEAAVELRAQLKAVLDPAPSFNDLVVKAAALALRDFPRANGAYRDGRFELYSRVNVGVAVAGQDALVVPTVFDADEKPLRVLAGETRALAERVRSGAITPPELSAGTFTVSNLGMYGMRRITPVINPPQAAILGVGELAPRAVVRDGAIVARHVMELTLVSDHRILYGADAATFLGRIRELLESPLRLAV
jgi:pyruvate dehydrogenase E2 component (dihydrolipoamide acetyltransferase)